MEDDPKITAVEKTQKVKDPKKVEAGKRLAAISRAAKERKANERQAATKVSDERSSLPLLLFDMSSILGAAAFIGMILYTRYGSGGGDSNSKEPNDPKDEQTPAPAPARPKRSLDSFD